MPSSLRRLTLLTALTLHPVGAASAEEVAVQVQSGRSIVVVQSASDITAASAQLGSLATATRGTEHFLVYVAPANVRTATDVVTYQVGTTAPVEKKISISPPDQTLADDALYSVSFKAIFVLLILAVLVENGLALLFRWRPYLAYFDARATNALVAFAIAFSFVRFFELDIVTTLVHAYRPDVENTGMSWVGSALTAAIIAGGSTAVNRVFQQLGFRPTGSEPPPVPRPPRTEAWISVALVRKKAVGPVFVSIQAPGEAPAFAGTIDGPGRRLSSWLRRTFTRNRSRYPQSGGHSVRLDVPLEIAVSGVDSDGNPLRQAWGPHAVAAGALLDLELSI